MFLASARLFRPERTLAGDFLRQRGAHLETSSELSDWNSNLPATIAQPPREPGGSGPRPRRGGLRSTLERKSRATNDWRKRSRGHLSRDRTLRRQKRQRPPEGKPADHSPGSELPLRKDLRYGPRLRPGDGQYHAASSTGPAQTSCRHGGAMRHTTTLERSDAD